MEDQGVNALLALDALSLPAQSLEKAVERMASGQSRVPPSTPQFLGLDARQTVEAGEGTISRKAIAAPLSYPVRFFVLGVGSPTPSQGAWRSAAASSAAMLLDDPA
jgi:hypothetical protein